MTGVVWDITERERQREALRKSEAQFTRLVESDVIGIITADIHGNITEANNAFLDLVGYRREELPLRWDKMTPPEWRPLDERAIAQLMKTGRVPPWEKEYIRKDGGRVPILVGVAILDEKKRTCICPVLDLSGLKRAETDLRKSEANLSALIENASEAIFSMDKEHRLVTFNSYYREQFLAAFGKEPRVGQNLDELMPGDRYSSTRAFWKSHLDRALAAERFAIETQLKIQGETRYFITSFTPILAEWIVSGVTVYAKDITELKLAEKALERQVEAEKLFSNVCREFINVELEEIDQAVATALRLIGEFTKADRSNLFVFSRDFEDLERVQEWCADGIESQMERLKKLDVRSFPRARDRIANLQVTRAPKVAELPPEAAAEREEFEAMGVRSALAVPIVAAEAPIGALGLQMCQSERTWPEETEWVLQLVGGIMGNALERTRAQRDLKQISHKNQMILEAAGEGIYGLDLEGRATFVNPAAAQMIGWEPEDLIGKPMHAVLHHTRPDGTPYPREACPINAASRDGEVHRSDDELFWRKDGGSFPVEYIGTPIREGGQITGAVVTFNDITLRKRAEEVRYLAHLLSEVPEAVLVMDSRGRIIFWSNGAENITGYGSQEVIGDDLDSILAREDPGGGARAILASLTTPDAEGEYRGEHLIRRRDGENRLVAIHFSPSKGRDGQGTAWIGIAQEITEARRRERELMHTQRLAEVGTLAAGVAHEINNPLTVLSGNIQGFLERARRDGQERKRFEQMKRVCDRISTVVDGLLRISAPTSEQWALMNVNEVIEETMGLVEQLHPKKRVKITRHYGSDLPKLQLLRGGLQQIVMNLMMNAMDATDEGGEIRVTTTKLPCAAPTGAGSPDPTCSFPGKEIRTPSVCLCVQDSGSGIPPAALSKVFLPFFSTKEPGKGTGLGLTLTRSIVSIHQGSIDVKSEPGRGTTFQVTLPIA
jgi:PAS domain S-box-containing protein